MKKLPVIVCILLAFLCIPACEVEECPPNALSFAKFQLVNQYGQAISYLDTLSVIGQIKADVTRYDTLADGTLKEVVVHDSLISDTLVNRETNVSTLSIPLSYDDETIITLVYNNTYKDQFTIHHRNIPYFLNLDCGTMMFYEVTGVTPDQIRMMDSIVITNPNIDNNEKENFKLYFTAATE